MNLHKTRLASNTTDQMHRHGIIGAGLIGGYLTAHLAPVLHNIDSNSSITVIGRGYARDDFGTEMSISDFATHTKTLNTCNVTFYEAVTHSVSTEQSLTVDVLWLTVKCTAIASVVNEIGPLLHDRTVIICCQNGIGSDAIVRDAFPKHQVYRAMFPFNVVKLGVGHFHRGSSGTVMLEHMLEKSDHDYFSELINGFKQQFYDTFPLDWCDDMDALLWAKCQVNLTNSVNALSNMSLKNTLLNNGYRRVIAQMMREHLQVCEALGIKLPKITKVSAKMIPRVLSLPDWLFPSIAKSMVDIDPAAKLSMWWDLELHRNTEIDYINGATINAARKFNIPTPMNDKVLTHIKALEQSPQRYAVSAQMLLGE